MKIELLLDILYQLNLLEKLLNIEQNPIKRVKYEAMRDTLLYVLEKEKDL